jgi:hypothetical protein
VKTKIALLGCLMVASTAAYAQTVDFNQNRTFQTTADRRVYQADGTTPLVGTNFVALLYYERVKGDTSLTPVALFNRFRNVPTTDPLAGTWVGATRTLTGRTSGDNVTLQVRIWDQTQFPTFEQACAAGGVWSQSATFTYTVPAPGSLPSAFYIENFRGIDPLASPPCIPEPGSVALTVIGTLTLLVLGCRHAVQDQ